MGSKWFRNSLLLGSILCCMLFLSSCVSNPFFTMELFVTAHYATHNTRNEGQSIQFSVSVTGGTAPYSYQWMKNGVPLPGEILPVLVRENLQVGDSGFYYVIVQDKSLPFKKMVISPIAQLTVTVEIPALQITTPLQNATRNVGDSVTFTVAATGGVPPYTYTWFKDGQQRGSQRSNIPYYPIFDIGTQDAGLYRVEVKDQQGTVQPSEARLTVVNPILPLTVTQMEDQLKLVGDNAIFEVEVSGGVKPYSFEWQKDGERIPGSTHQYPLPRVDKSHAGIYTVIVTDNIGNERTRDAELTVVDPVSELVATEMENQTKLVGQTAVFTVHVAGGVAPYHFVWTNEQGAVLPERSNTLTLPGLTQDDSGRYTVTITDSNGVSLERQVELTVEAPTLPLTVTFEPSENQVRQEGDPDNNSITFKVTVSGGTPINDVTPYSVVWMKDNEPWVTGTDARQAVSTYEREVFGLIAANTGYYSVTVKDATNVPKSAGVHLQVLPAAPEEPLRFITQPVPQRKLFGDSVEFSVEVTGGKPPYNYQWYKDGNRLDDLPLRINGSRTKTLSIRDLTLRDDGDYHVVVKDADGKSIESDKAALIVKEVPDVSGRWSVLIHISKFSVEVRLIFNVEIVGDGLRVSIEYEGDTYEGKGALHFKNDKWSFEMDALLPDITDLRDLFGKDVEVLRCKVQSVEIGFCKINGNAEFFTGYAYFYVQDPDNPVAVAPLSGTFVVP